MAKRSTPEQLARLHTNALEWTEKANLPQTSQPRHSMRDNCDEPKQFVPALKGALRVLVFADDSNRFRDTPICSFEILSIEARRHVVSIRRMLEVEVISAFLAFGIPGSAPDEHLSSTQPNDWSSHEPDYSKRCKEPPVSSLPHKDPFVRAGKPARRNRLLGWRTGCNPGKSIEFC